MNLYLIPIVIGTLMAMNPQMAWVGVGLMAIGAVLYGMSQREPMQFARGPPRYMRIEQQMRQRMGRPGVEMSRRDVATDMSETANSPYGESPQNVPRIEGGMFKLPLPIDEDVTKFTDVTYNIPTKAKGFRQEKDKGGNPWLPGF
jgi:hypothetical protein